MRVLMCHPDFIHIKYEINDWMYKENPPNLKRSRKQWQNVVTAYKDAGVKVCFIAPDQTAQDMCFTANSGWFFGGKMLLSNYVGKARVARQHEIPHYEKWFRKHRMDLNDVEVIPFPNPDIAFEGQGDIVTVYTKGNEKSPYVLMGYGEGRTDYEAAEILQSIHKLPPYKILPLELIKGEFYHLDTACVFIPPNTLLYYPPAFSRDAKRTIDALPVKKIKVSKGDARNFVCNGVAVPTDNETLFITSKTSDKLVRKLQKRNIRVVQLDTSEFKKNGGSVRCLTLVLPENKKEDVMQENHGTKISSDVGAHLVRNYDYPEKTIFVRGYGCFLYDKEGRAYLDCMSCYSAIPFGYNYPDIMQALYEQCETGLTIISRSFLAEELELFTDELAGFAGMDMVLPMNSGAEGVETAIKIARRWAYTVKKVEENCAEIIFCDNNFHGRTLGVISGSTSKEARENFGPFMPNYKLVRFGNISDLYKTINENTAAIIVEPIQAEGGIIVPPEGYFAELRELCTKENVLFIADEIQTGLGRTGHMFACEYEGVKPDLYILGKALGGGVMPISAVAGPREIMEVLTPGSHGSTFGGNPLACHVARATLRVLREKKIDRHTLKMGVIFRSGLKDIAERHPGVIKEIRGRGLLIGVELSEKGPTGKEVCARLMQEGLLTKETHDYTLRLSPALTITEEEVAGALKIIERVFSKIHSHE
jgi:ornithine--oxo-acid transaminase